MGIDEKLAVIEKFSWAYRNIIPSFVCDCKCFVPCI